MEELQSVMDPKLYVGRAPELTERFLKEEVEPILVAEIDALAEVDVELKV
jgi:adenylosuccinate lyase